MLHTAALPFVLRRAHDVISGRFGPIGQEITSTRDHIHGLLYLNGEEVVIQWRTSREVSRVGTEIRTDRELGAVHEVALPLSAVAGAAVRRVWRRWWFGEALVLTAADLRAFDALTGEGDLPGLLLEHPAEIVLEVRRADGPAAQAFASTLRLAVSEQRLAASEDALRAHRLEGEAAPEAAQPEAAQPEAALTLEADDAEGEDRAGRGRTERQRT